MQHTVSVKLYYLVYFFLVINIRPVLCPLKSPIFQPYARLPKGFPSLSQAHVLDSSKISTLTINLPMSCPQITTSVNST